MARAKKLLDPSKLPGSFSSRVFIGGSYNAVPSRTELPAPRETLQNIRAMVKKERLHPIMADEYEVDDIERNIHHDAIYLLHSCRLAIFELTDFSGAMMEIERTADFGTMCMVLHSDPGADGWRLSRMLSSFVREHHARIRLYGYNIPSEAVGAARNWLLEMKGLGHAKAE